ncbi:hypothetical protein MBLNU459_g4346t1 [Dothideomycetes sp. NU459]
MSSNTAPTTSTTSTTGGSNAGQAAGEGVKGIFAKGHGIGEALRGNINSAIDSFTGDKAAEAKNAEIAKGGEREFSSGNFERRGMDKAL